jgi:hypothetical protein
MALPDPSYQWFLSSISRRAFLWCCIGLSGSDRPETLFGDRFLQRLIDERRHSNYTTSGQVRADYFSRESAAHVMQERKGRSV